MTSDSNSRFPDVSSRASELPAVAAPVPPQHWVCTPPIDIFETPEGLVLRADLPGVTAETLDLQVQDNKLTLLGRVAPQAPAGATLIHQEYHVGDFVRSFILSDDVDHERISAKISNGVLDLLLPRIPKAEPRKIQVRAD
jgi:HSP20 family protein